MRRALVTVTLCTLLVTAYMAAGQARDDAAAPAGASKEKISELFRQYTKALLDKDMKTLDRLWADELTFVNPRGDLRTKKQRMTDVGSGETAFESIEMSEELVRTYGDDAAVLTCRGNLKAKYSGKESSGDYRITVVCARPKGDWQIVAIHMTPVQK